MHRSPTTARHRRRVAPTRPTSSSPDGVIRDARPDEVAALEALQRRGAGGWGEYREALAAHPDAIALDPALVREGRVRVFEKDGLRVGFSVLLPVREGACELDGLFVEPAAMRGGVGRALMADVADRGRAEGAARISVIANPRAV